MSLVKLVPKVKVPGTHVDIALGDEGFSLEEFGIPAQVIYTPGHTLGSVSILLENGVSGARLMGAGFGGMVLAYLETDVLQSLVKKVEEGYYNRFTGKERGQHIFPCVVADGAGQI